MRAQVIYGQIIGIGDVTGAGTYQLPAEMPAYFADNYHLYDAQVQGDLVTELLLVRTPAAPSVLAEILANGAQNRDYKVTREKLKAAITTLGGFENLSIEDKRIAAENFVTSLENIEGTLTLNEQLEAGEIFDANSKDSRRRRYDKVYNYFRGTLNTADAMQVLGGILANNLEFKYVVLGFEGDGAVNFKGEPDQHGILDFLKGNAPFEASGVSFMPLTPKHGLTKEQLISKAVDIIKYGNY